jgi:hypothetical protein
MYLCLSLTLAIWDQYLAPFHSTSARLFRGEKFTEVFGDHYDAVEKSMIKLDPPTASAESSKKKPPTGKGAARPPPKKQKSTVKPTKKKKGK